MPLHPPHRAVRRRLPARRRSDRAGRSARLPRGLDRRAPDRALGERAGARSAHRPGARADEADEARHRRDAAGAAQSRVPGASPGHARSHGPGRLSVGHRRRRHPDRPGAVRPRSAPIPPPCAPARPRCWRSCSSCGPRTASSRYHGTFFDIETPVFDPVKDRGYYMKPYQQPHPPDRGRGQHARLRLHADGGRARLHPDVELAALPLVSERPLAPGRGRSGQGRPQGEPARVAHRTRRAGRRPPPRWPANGRASVLGRNYDAASASQSRRHHPDGVDQARPRDGRRGGDRSTT